VRGRDTGGRSGGKYTTLAVLLFVSGEILGQTPDSSAFVCRELLGRPTATSVALNVCTDREVELFVEFGTAPSAYSAQTAPLIAHAGIPATVTIAPLNADSPYYYRLRYRQAGAGPYHAFEEHTFHTARRRGSAYVFAIEADPHLDTATNADLYKRTLDNVRAAGPDFLIDLGDTFMSDKLPVQDLPAVTARHLLLRSYFERCGHSIPLMLVIGNHEGELGWLLDGTPDNLAVLATRTRRSYFANPVPDWFYSGDTTHEAFVGQRQSYYAWEWGSALFVVLDPYWHTVNKPGATKNLWDWTLGERQYRWLESTLAGSTARLKFVFAHQLVGGLDPEGRGGIEAVPFYEMGGRNGDSSWGFAAARPGWPRPLHQLMVDNHVTAVFHGHDHVFVKQELDGIVYQELPQPGYYNVANPEKSYSNTGLAAKYGYTHGVIYSSSGFLRVSVTDTEATVAYVRSYLPEHETGGRRNGEVAFSYALKASGPVSSAAPSTPHPDWIGLSQNYPNPFNPATVIEYHVPAAGQVTLAVFDVLGREVAVLVRETQGAGIHEVRWVASGLPTGVYLLRLTTGGQAVTRTMSLIR
jgi:hypothetical protein